MKHEIKNSFLTFQNMFDMSHYVNGFWVVLIWMDFALYALKSWQHSWYIFMFFFIWLFNTCKDLNDLLFKAVI